MSKGKVSKKCLQKNYRVYFYLLPIHYKCLSLNVSQELHGNLTSRRHEFWNNASWWQIFLGHLVCWRWSAEYGISSPASQKSNTLHGLRFLSCISIDRFIDIMILVFTLLYRKRSLPLPPAQWHGSPAIRYVDCVWNVMAHAQKPDFAFRRNKSI